MQVRCLKILIELNQSNSGNFTSNKKQLNSFINILEYMLSSQNDDNSYMLNHTDIIVIIKLVLKNLPDNAESAEKIVNIVLSQVY